MESVEARVKVPIVWGLPISGKALDPTPKQRHFDNESEFDLLHILFEPLTLGKVDSFSSRRKTNIQLQAILINNLIKIIIAPTIFITHS